MLLWFPTYSSFTTEHGCDTHSCRGFGKEDLIGFAGGQDGHAPHTRYSYAPLGSLLILFVSFNSYLLPHTQNLDHYLFSTFPESVSCACKCTQGLNQQGFQSGKNSLIFIMLFILTSLLQFPRAMMFYFGACILCTYTYFTLIAITPRFEGFEGY